MYQNLSGEHVSYSGARPPRRFLLGIQTWERVWMPVALPKVRCDPRGVPVDDVTAGASGRCFRTLTDISDEATPDNLFISGHYFRTTGPGKGPESIGSTLNKHQTIPDHLAGHVHEQDATSWGARDRR
jgi:hypothetical protein